jgi:hypothetical protein
MHICFALLLNKKGRSLSGLPSQGVGLRGMRREGKGKEEHLLPSLKCFAVTDVGRRGMHLD